LDGLGALQPGLLARALEDTHPGVRINALRLAETRATPSLIDAAARRVESADAKELLQLACTLGAWDTPEAGTALGRLAVAYHADPFITAAVLSSAVPHSLALAEAVLAAGGPALSALWQPLVDLALALDQRAAVARLLKPALTPSNGQFTSAQWELFSQFLDTLARRKTNWRALEKAEPDDLLSQQLRQVTPLFDSARQLASNLQAPEDERRKAASLLVRDPVHRAEGLSRLAPMLSPRTSGEAQRETIRVLGVSGDERVPELLAHAWPGLGPATRLAALDELLSREPWTFALASLIESGSINAGALDGTRRGRLLRHSSTRVKELATRVLSAEAPTARAEAVEAFRPALALTGDRARGLRVYEERCAACHKVGESGLDIGPNLVSVAHHPLEKLLVSIVDPNASIEPGFTAYTVERTGGEELYGLIVAETGNSLVLKLGDGTVRTLLRSDIRTIRSAELSFMPEGLEEGLSPSDFADLLRFIQELGNP
jgi:putative heme-binding domain-containing protein